MYTLNYLALISFNRSAIAMFFQDHVQENKHEYYSIRFVKRLGSRVFYDSFKQ